MKLGAFSISLNVKDIEASKQFYEKLGFKDKGGDLSQKWLILQNDDGHIIGLFEGMFDKNMLTFNPGWDQNAHNLAQFDDVRTINTSLKQQGLNLDAETNIEGQGPASFVVVDPDGNPILIDQHR